MFKASFVLIWIVLYFSINCFDIAISLSSIASSIVIASKKSTGKTVEVFALTVSMKILKKISESDSFVLLPSKSPIEKSTKLIYINV